ncbi:MULTISPECIES: DUF2623 family protein [Musicola]|uniref:DUF2623 domain-containing protein n=1 Tax=Musicola paradisiaca (strain Ech703) TaxID=579405 RepID=C6C5L7_MUSP7|nr:MULTISPECIES: DUF2623 family protein [Musicola]ACS83830.1 conserved hypothetical protein [Musicola paradisiaca Ech703]
MKNHFGDGILAGLNASGPLSDHDIRRYCDDFRRGYVCGYAHQRAGLCGRLRAAFEAGQLSRRYGLRRDIVAEFFTDVQQPTLVQSFYDGYDQYA